MFGFKTWRRRRVAKKTFPESWLNIIKEYVPYYHMLPDEDRLELLSHIRIFMSEKRFEGCGGLEITDEIRLPIAAQACILLLHRRTDYYPGMSTILVYPAAYMAPTTERLPDGVVAEGLEVHAGESWPHGSVVLSWEDVREGAADPYDGYNVVFHEFAHQIDEAGATLGADSVFQDRSRLEEWARVFREGFEELRRDLGRDRDTFLDEYAASDPTEFFAVATEYFFELPRELKHHHPELYDELKFFYRQDPAELWDL